MKLQSKGHVGVLITGLLVVFVATLALSIRHQSQTFDEGFHLVAGYRYWQCRDFGMNSEHPPLVKYVAAAPLWFAHELAPEGSCGDEPTTKDHGYALGVNYLYGQHLDGDAMLYRARLATSLFAVLLAGVCFLFARELFGATAGLVALLLMVFEPTILAHGGLITTDTAVSAFMLAAVYSLYRYYRRPSRPALLATGFCTGLAFAAKHSGILIVPILAVLALAELAISRRSSLANQPLSRDLWRRTVTLAAILAVSIISLWAVYGFRFAARPDGHSMTVPLAQFITNAKAQGTHGAMLTTAVPLLARWNLLPEAYLYGLVDVLNVSDPGQPPFLLGTLYPHGRWFYFPIVFVIKSTLGFLALLLLSLIFGHWSGDRRLKLVYLVIPPILIVLIAMQSGLDIGYRHILPIIAFLCILIAGGVVYVWERNRAWRIVVGGLLLIHVASSLHSFPNYLPYSNEAWGGTMNTYRYLTDSNVDWGQGLYQARDYLKSHNIVNCWIAYDGAASLTYYDIPCRTLAANAGDAHDVPPFEAEGLFVLGDLTVSGIEWEPGDLNPYRDFQKATPIANIAGAMQVYQGHFDLTKLAAATHIARSGNMLGENKPVDALCEAQAALMLTPDSVRAHLSLGQAQSALSHTDEARKEFESALALADKAGRQWYPLQIAMARQELKKLDSSANH
jgi:4-amino-4-deoxy-L-arabinose transferase-like glycosyltransferase